MKDAAEFTPELRRFLPLGEVVGAAAEDAGGDSVADMVADHVRRLAEAARDASFEPVVELLAEHEHGENLRIVASDDVIQGARGLVRESGSGGVGRRERERAEEVFKLCVGALAKSTVAAYGGVTSLQLEVLEAKHGSRRRRIELRDDSLKRRLASISNETLSSVESGASCGEGRDGTCEVD